MNLTEKTFETGLFFEKWKKRIDQKTNPGAAEYNPAVDTTAYNPLLDSTITMNTALPTTKRFHPYGT